MCDEADEISTKNAKPWHDALQHVQKMGSRVDFATWRWLTTHDLHDRILDLSGAQVCQPDMIDLPDGSKAYTFFSGQSVEAGVRIASDGYAPVVEKDGMGELTIGAPSLEIWLHLQRMVNQMGFFELEGHPPSEEAQSYCDRFRPLERP